jgi:hypothetical protein
MHFLRKFGQNELLAPIFTWKVEMGWDVANGNLRILIQTVDRIRLNSELS